MLPNMHVRLTFKIVSDLNSAVSIVPLHAARRSQSGAP
jgi:hypothetical protein